MVLWAEGFRLICIFSCYALLCSGYARGGKLQLRALQEVRLDAATGALDGHTVTSRVAARRIKSMSKEHGEIIEFDEAELYNAAEVARKKLAIKVAAQP